MIEVFRLNGALLSAGDALVGDLGLTSARWQVLGAIALAGTPLPVSHLARNMGLTRQAVQRVVDDMHAEGLLAFDSNPHHRRAKLVTMTEPGKRAYGHASDRQADWARALSCNLSPNAIDAAGALLLALRVRLDAADHATTRPENTS